MNMPLIASVVLAFVTFTPEAAFARANDCNTEARIQCRHTYYAEGDELNQCVATLAPVYCGAEAHRDKMAGIGEGIMDCYVGEWYTEEKDRNSFKDCVYKYVGIK